MTFCQLALASVLFASSALPIGESAASAKTFETPEAAWKALLETMRSGDWSAVEALLGPAAAFVPPGARTPERLKKTADDIGKAPLKVDVQGNQATFVVGGRPFPVAAQKREKGWVLGDNAKAREGQAAVVKEFRCLSNLKLIGIAASMFEQKSGKPLPNLEALTMGAESERLLQPSQLLCPFVGDGKHLVNANGLPCDYLFIPLKAAAPKEAIYAFCPKRNHPGGVRTCVFRDGTARKIESEGEFRSALKASLEAAGIIIEPSKGVEPALPEGSPARNPEWRKAIRVELGLDEVSAPVRSKPSEAKTGDTKPAVKKAPVKKPGSGKTTKKKGADEAPRSPAEPDRP